jgi:mRNA-degrading endonuclease RelE of RelBE toxin-antitoxin system
MSEYVLKVHAFYYQPRVELTDQVRELRQKLRDADYYRHPVVKFARRVREADKTIIPQNPDRPEYRLRGDLKKYRRYKQGLKRYRLFFCFANHPPIILYLYLTDDKSLRKQKDKNDPYQKFRTFVSRGNVSHDPHDPKIQKWIRAYRFDGP